MKNISYDKQDLLTHSLLTELVDYDPDTGIFTRKSTGKSALSVNKSGYGQISFYLDGKAYCYRTHRLAWFYMTGEWPEETVDHINRVKTDNRFCNLRLATNRENASNRCDNVDRVGVVYVPQNDSWYAYYTKYINGKTRSRSKNYACKKWSNAKELAIQARIQFELEGDEYFI